MLIEKILYSIVDVVYIYLPLNLQNKIFKIIYKREFSKLIIELESELKESD